MFKHRPDPQDGFDISEDDYLEMAAAWAEADETDENRFTEEDNALLDALFDGEEDLRETYAEHFQEDQPEWI